MTVLSSYVTTTHHSCAEIYARWADPATWSDWDPEVASVRLEGPAMVGARGRLTPANGPAQAFIISALRPDREFTNRAALPGAHLEFEHLVEPDPAGSRICVTVRVHGVLRPLWARILRRPLGPAARLSVTGLLAALPEARGHTLCERMEP